MSGIYVHVPFCKQACHYCDFYFVTGKADQERYVKAVLKEAELRKSFLAEEPLESLYLGGGTPSRLSPQLLGELISGITELFPLSAAAEITMEANPDDINIDYLRLLKVHTPVNRFSMGVQSFLEADLKWMHRAHNAQQAIDIIPMLRSEGFSNFSLDLIYGTPTLSDADWKKNLDIIAEHRIPHFSAYSLTLESGTALDKLVHAGKKEAPNEDKSARHLDMLMDFARAQGYLHYEISNLCLPGHEAVHNSNYWKGKAYLGLGPAAHSFNGNLRTMNVRNLDIYAKSVLEEQKLAMETEILSERDIYNEQIMTGLRQEKGISLSEFQTRFGEKLLQQLLDNAAPWLEKAAIRNENGYLFLSREGRFLADAIASDLFWV